MDYNEIINLTSIGLLVIGLIILVIGIIYIPNNLPTGTVILSQDNFNKTLNNYRLNSLGFKLIIVGSSILIIGIISLLINIFYWKGDIKIVNNQTNIKKIVNNQTNIKKIEENHFDERQIKLIKQWTGRTPEEVEKIRKDFFAAKRNTN